MLKTSFAFDLRERLLSFWREDLEQFGVIYPEGGAHEAGLLALYSAYPEALSQKSILEFYAAHSDKPYNLQLRHLASDGWDIRSGNKRFTQGRQDLSLKHDELVLASFRSPNPLWLNSGKFKRQGGLLAHTWEEKLQLYKSRGCSVCGQKFATYDKGHLDPEREYSDSNVVPMCSPCNNWAQDRITFKLDGLIARPVFIEEN